MSRTKIASFTRAHEYENGCEPNTLPVSNCPLWLEVFAVEMAKKEKTAVEVAKDRSIYDQMNAIMGNQPSNPKFSSVDEIVSDIRDRVGLNDYLKKVKSRSVQDAAKHVLAAAEKKNLKSDNFEIPELIQRVPAIDSFIKNMIETSYGIQLPAIQLAISSTFSREGVRQQDADDPELARYINKLLMDRNSCGDQGDYSNLGKGVGVHREYDSVNQNPFFSLMPARDTY